tara:strand:- start:463 stop:837 length:375 start_codon:yes stop_codon:yes gene_type:complete
MVFEKNKGGIKFGLHLLFGVFIAHLLTFISIYIGNFYEHVYYGTAEPVLAVVKPSTPIESLLFTLFLSLWIYYIVKQKSMKNKINEKFEELERRIRILEDTPSDTHDLRLERRLIIKEIKEEGY